MTASIGCLVRAGALLKQRVGLQIAVSDFPNNRSTFYNLWSGYAP
jgi:hypothetical protein